MDMNSFRTLGESSGETFPMETMASSSLEDSPPHSAVKTLLLWMEAAVLMVGLSQSMFVELVLLCLITHILLGLLMLNKNKDVQIPNRKEKRRYNR